MSLAVPHRSPTAPHGRRSRAAAVGVSLLALGALLMPAVVTAHGASATFTCNDGQPVLQVDLAYYDDTNPNTVDVAIDGAEVAGSPFSFGGTYDGTWAAVPATSSHTALVKVTAWDDPDDDKGYSPTFDLSVDACQQATPSPVPTPSPTPTPVATPTPTPIPTPTPTESALPSQSAKPTPSGSAASSSSAPAVTPPATDTGGSSGGSTDGLLILVLALMGLTATGILVMVPNPVNRRRR